jgi:hypothetical protein
LLGGKVARPLRSEIVFDRFRTFSPGRRLKRPGSQVILGVSVSGVANGANLITILKAIKAVVS